jgi:Uma2 family endonuclease
MSVSSPNHGVSVEEYLRYEADGRIRHEYIAGEIFAITGASLEHNLIAGNVFAAVAAHSRGGPCMAFMSDFKLRMKNNMDDIFYYPDVMVACGREGVEKYYLRNPKLIVEVLSPTTEAIDRREKALHYRQIPSLEEYILIAQEMPEVTIYRRASGWNPVILTSLAAAAEFHSIKLSLSLSQIYEGVWK